MKAALKTGNGSRVCGSTGIRVTRADICGCRMTGSAFSG